MSTAQQPRRVMTPLEGALWAVAKGFYVSPIAKGTKDRFLKKWSREEGRTNNADQVRAWAKTYENCNWAIITGPSNLAVLDVDNKNGSKGSDTLVDLEIYHGPLPETPTVSTPNDGAHRYMRGIVPSKAHNVGPGLDTRGIGGLVICPGAVVDGKPYVLTQDVPVPLMPEWMSSLACAGWVADRPESEQIPVVDWDEPNAVATATRYLQGVEPAVEGEKGDEYTYKVAARLKDFGVSEPTALELMLDHFNDRCAPPWDPEALEVKIFNAYYYAKFKRPGEDSPDHLFGDDFEDSPGSGDMEGKPVNAKPRLPVIHCSAFAGEPKPREWLLPEWLPKHEAVLFSGDGGVGKSLVAMQMAVALAAGVPFFGIKTTGRTPVLYMACEDKIDELHRRYRRCADSMGYFLDLDSIPLHFSPMVGEETLLCVPGANGIMEKGPAWEKLSNTLEDSPQTLVILDTLTDVFAGNENARNDVNQFAKHLLGSLINTHDCTVLVLGHTSKSKDSEYSGSTHWNNAFRARMFLGRDEETDHRILRRGKANYAASGDGTDIRLFWDNGVFSACPANFEDATDQDVEIMYQAIVKADAKGCRLKKRETQKDECYLLADIKGQDGRPMPKATRKDCVQQLTDSGRIVYAEEKGNKGYRPTGEFNF